MDSFDYLVIGAGIAGASAGYGLAAHGRVALLERESQAGYHTTGRSAALFSETYGNAIIRGLSVGSRGFFRAPPEGFAAHALLSPRGALCVGRADQLAKLDAAAEEGRRLVASVRRIDRHEARNLVPALRPEAAVGAVFEPEAMDIDVHALHHGFLRGLKARGGRLITDAEVRGLARRSGTWVVETPAGGFTTPVLVNAAGAWCDEIAKLASARPVGLVPKRRTVITFDPPADHASEGWPLVVGIDEDFYFKPDAGQMLGSPADETPSPPCDARPEELDVAIAVDRIQAAADLTITRIRHSWAGLRSFVADKTMVAGFDPACDGFFWLAGQGGYGMQTAPAMSRLATALATGAAVPPDLQDLGVTAAALAPERFAGGRDHQT